MLVMSQDVRMKKRTRIRISDRRYRGCRGPCAGVTATAIVVGVCHSICLHYPGNFTTGLTIQELKTRSASVVFQGINSASAPSQIVCSILVSTLFCHIDHVFPNLHSPFPTASLPHGLLGHTRRPLHPPMSTYHISELVRLHYPLFCPTNCPHRWWR